MKAVQSRDWIKVKNPEGPAMVRASGADGTAGARSLVIGSPPATTLGPVAPSLLHMGSVAVATQAAASIPIDRLNASNDG